MFKNDRPRLALAALTVVTLLATPVFRWLPLVVALMMLASVSVLRLGIFARLAVAAFVYGIVGSMAIELTTLLGVGMNFVALSLVLLGLAFLYAWQGRNRLNFETSILDVCGLLVGLATFAVLARPYFGASTSKTLTVLMTGEDNSSHLQMYRYVVEDKKYAYRNDVSQAGIRPSLLSYAQGSHGAMATLTAPFVERSSENVQLRAYVYAAAITFSMTFWFAFLLISRPLRAIKDLRIQAGLGGLLTLLFILFVPLGVFLSLYTYGYYPQYFAYMALALMLLVVTAAAEAPAKKASQVMAEFGLVALSFYGVFAGWYLLAPVTIPVELAYLWLNREQLLVYKKFVLVLLIPLAAMLAYLAYVYVFMSNGAGHLLTPGGVDKLRVRSLFVVIPAAVMAVMEVRRRQWQQAGLSVALLAAAAVTLAIGGYQHQKIHHLDYYFYKTMFTVLLVAVVYYGYIFTAWLAAILAKLKPAALWDRQILWPAIGLLVTLFSIGQINLPRYLDAYTTQKYSIPQQAPGRLLDVLTNDNLDDSYSDVLVLSSCNPYTNFTGTIWSSAYSLPYNQQRGLLEGNLLGRSKELDQANSKLIKEIAEYSETKQKPVAIVLGEIYCKPTFTNNVTTQLSNAPNIRFIDTNGNLLR